MTCDRSGRWGSVGGESELASSSLLHGAVVRRTAEPQRPRGFARSNETYAILAAWPEAEIHNNQGR